MGHVAAKRISIRVTVNVIMAVRSRLAAADITIKRMSIAAAVDMTIMNTSIAAAAVMKIMSRSVAAAAVVPVVMNMATMDRIRRNCCA